MYNKHEIADNISKMVETLENINKTLKNIDRILDNRFGPETLEHCSVSSQFGTEDLPSFIWNEGSDK